MLVDYNTYTTLHFTCPQCGWQGTGKELSHGDFSELHAIGDLECPNCTKLIAHWQEPLYKPDGDAV